jgi:hypothetical protein
MAASTRLDAGQCETPQVVCMSSTPELRIAEKPYGVCTRWILCMVMVGFAVLDGNDAKACKHERDRSVVGC